MANSQGKTQSIISALPSEDGWLSDDDIRLHQYQGFWYYVGVVRGLLDDEDSSRWNLLPSDILICSTPKSGTTWLKALAFAIVTRNRFQPNSENSPLCSTISHELIPFVELQKGPVARYLGVPLLSTHLSYTRLPSSVFNSGSKIVYICRDPKDAFISRWLFAHKMTEKKGSTQLIPLHQAFDLFCRGVSPFGPYWDHVQGYWRGSLDQPEKVLFLKYEDMMRNPLSNLISLAAFLGYPFSKEEEADGVPMKIVNLCCFDSLSNMKGSSKSNTLAPVMGIATSLTNDIYFRKGKVGDWKNYLTAEMGEKMDQITEEKLGCFGLQL